MPALADGDDVGDGNPSCNAGEICLVDWRGSTNRTAQFWWSEGRYYWADGSVRTWFYVPTLSYTTV